MTLIDGRTSANGHALVRDATVGAGRQRAEEDARVVVLLLLARRRHLEIVTRAAQQEFAAELQLPYTSTLP